MISTIIRTQQERVITVVINTIGINQVVEPASTHICQFVTTGFAEGEGTAIAEEDGGRGAHHAGFRDGTVRFAIHVDVEMMVAVGVGGIGSLCGIL